ncbi:CLUMA_CG016843, isoform A [Clunio marinus]|uniref:CLUMA_CG016843, isoform A n=1 Tax=Clunio marinus TaxID=568069 RepID=A0A1J1IUE0_9DIPT|nr:CLUMA_CG016843, isoform A [Clunio marinus]
MENKVESPDYQMMDISETITTTDNISTSSASPTISNQADNDINNLDEKSSRNEAFYDTINKVIKAVDRLPDQVWTKACDYIKDVEKIYLEEIPGVKIKKEETLDIKKEETNDKVTC